MCRTSQVRRIRHTNGPHYTVAHVDFCLWCNGSWHNDKIDSKYRRDPEIVTRCPPPGVEWADYDTYFCRLTLHEERAEKAKSKGTPANHFQVPATKFRILDLPPELRNRVYAFYMADAQANALLRCDCNKCRNACVYSDRYFPEEDAMGYSHLTHPRLTPYGNTGEPALTRVNYQMRYETLPTWYGLWTIAIMFAPNNSLMRDKEDGRDVYRGIREPKFLMAPEKLRMAGSLRFAVDAEDSLFRFADNKKLWAGIRRFLKQMLTAQLSFNAFWVGVDQGRGQSLYIPCDAKAPKNNDRWWDRDLYDPVTGGFRRATDEWYERLIKTCQRKYCNIITRCAEECSEELDILGKDEEEDAASETHYGTPKTTRGQLCEQDLSKSFSLGDQEPDYYTAFMEDDDSLIGAEGLDDFRLGSEGTEAFLSDEPTLYWVTHKRAGVPTRIVRLKPVSESYWWNARVGQEELQMQSVYNESLGYCIPTPVRFGDEWANPPKASITAHPECIETNVRGRPYGPFVDTLLLTMTDNYWKSRQGSV